MTDVFYGPRSRSNARALLASAEALELDPSVVRTTQGGYLVPSELIEHMESLAHIKEGEMYAPPGGEAPTRPNVNESKADWFEYAKAIGLAPVDETTKADLIDMVKTAEAEKESN